MFDPKKEKRTPTNPFKKGDPRINRKGHKRISKEVQEKLDSLRRITTENYIAKFNELFNADYIKLRTLALSQKTDSLTSYMARCIIKGRVKGDYYALDKMMERLIGKVPLAIKHSGTMLQTNVDMSALSVEELKNIAKLADK
jgi:hypothetical protein